MDRIFQYAEHEPSTEVGGREQICSPQRKEIHKKIVHIITVRFYHTHTCSNGIVY